jgi:hypothetical protein
VAATETVFDRISVEIARGCTEGCRFCQAGMIYRPVRERSPESVVDTIVRAVKEGGYDEASLTSLSTADYSCIAPLVKKVMAKLKDEKVSLSVSSLRAYGLGEELLDEIQSVRATGLTFAPEAGTQRMRDVVNKNVTEEQLMETAERVFSRGWAKMKLYFMIGLPTEQDEDVVGIVETGRKARDVGRRAQKGRGPDGDRERLDARPQAPHALPVVRHGRRSRTSGASRPCCERRPARRRSTSSCTSRSAAPSRRSSRGATAASPTSSRRLPQRRPLRLLGGAPALGPLAGRARAHNVDVPAALGTIPVTARLPWDHLDVGLEDGFLLREYRKALANRLSPPCGKVGGQFIHHTNLEDAKADTRKLVCYDCGVACDLTDMRQERFVYLEQLTARTRPAPKEAVTMTPRSAARGRSSRRASRSATASPSSAPGGRPSRATSTSCASCRGCSAGPSCRCSTRRASTRSPR